jgi:hypothetical protein
MLTAMAASTVLAIVSLLIHYEALSLAARWVPRIRLATPRFRIVFAVLACFVAHTLEVWLWAVGYAVLAWDASVGGLMLLGKPEQSWLDYLYFSAVTYTTIGFGDIYPTGGLRLVAGAEGLIGLLMIGWSASFTYFEMRELWKGQEPADER